MIRVEIEFRGLIDLVSDKSSTPERSTFLFPNATEPDAGWIPEILRFDMPHQPRLLVREGQIQSSGGPVKQWSRCGEKGMERLPGVDLSWQHVTLKNLEPLPGYPTHSQDRHKVNDPNSASSCKSSLDYDPNMDRLSSLCMPRNGEIDWTLMSPKYKRPDENERLITRFIVKTGHLSAQLWQRGGRFPRVRFLEKRSGGTGWYERYRRFVVESYLLEGQVDDSLEIYLSELGIEDQQSLIVAPDSSRIHLVVENSPAHCHFAGQHFLGHYLVRDRWNDYTHVRLPDIALWVSDGAGNNPQCSPGDNGG